MERAFTYHQTNGVGYLCAPLFAHVGVSHMFTTREGGVSKGSLASLNLGLERGDKPEHVAENYRRVCEILGVRAADCIMAKQIHSTRVQTVGWKDAGKGIQKPEERPEADGLITDVPGLPLAVFCADCVPILLYHEATHCLAAVHAGWRGTVGGIAAVAVRKMQDIYGAKPHEIIAAIGPSIGPCHFEVGAEVAEEFCRNGFEAAVHPSAVHAEKFDIDLWESNRRVLCSAGVSKEHVDVARTCTMCHTERYFSHRGAGADTGRMALIAAIRQNPEKGLEKSTQV